MSGRAAFAGGANLTRFAVRRDRVRTAIWVLAMAALAFATVPAITELFPTEAERAARAPLAETPTGVIFGGPGFGLEDLTLGPIVVGELLMFALLVVAVMSVMIVVRHTRAEEETARAELIRANAVGRAASLTAALALAALTNVLIGAVIVLALITSGLPTSGSVLFGVIVTATGLVFVGVGAVTAQVTEHSRTSTGLGIAAIGVWFFARALGDIAEPDGHLLSWLSPFAWGFQARPYADARWWPVVLLIAAAVILTALGFWLSYRRDFAAGLVRPRLGSATASRLLVRPLGLHGRLQRGSIIAWAAGILVIGLAFGSVAHQVPDLVESNPDVAVLIGGDSDALLEGFFGTMVGYVSMAVAGFAIASVGRIAAEESAGRAENVLATALSRIWWAGSGLVLTLATVIGLMALGGLGLGVSGAVSLEDGSWLGSTFAAVAAQLAVPMLFVAMAVLLYGVLPRLQPIVWGWFGLSVAITMFGALLELPQWAMRISPFELLAQVPAESFDLTAAVLVGSATVVFLAAGLIGFRRRDLATE